MILKKIGGYTSRHVKAMAKYVFLMVKSKFWGYTDFANTLKTTWN